MSSDILSNGRNTENSVLISLLGGVSEAMSGGSAEGFFGSGTFQSILTLHTVISIPLVSGQLSSESSIFVNFRVRLAKLKKVQ